MATFTFYLFTISQSPRNPVQRNIHFPSTSYDFLNFLDICCDASLLSLILLTWAASLSSGFIFCLSSQRTIVPIGSLYEFLFVSMTSSSALTFIISFPLLFWDLICSCLSKILGYTIKLFVCGLSYCLVEALGGINLPLGTAFFVSQRFVYVVSSFSFNSRNSLYSLLDFFNEPFFIQ